MNAHQLDASGVIINTVVVDGLNVFPNLIDASLGGEIGGSWDGTTFTPPPPPPAIIPNTVSMRQARLALLGAGLLATVNTAISAMTGAEGEAARIEWEYATEVRRDSPLVSGLSVALALTAAEMDALFVAADAL